jgi:WD40 repeat protein
MYVTFLERDFKKGKVQPQPRPEAGDIQPQRICEFTNLRRLTRSCDNNYYLMLLEWPEQSLKIGFWHFENPLILTAASLDKAMKFWENFMSKIVFSLFWAIYSHIAEQSVQIGFWHFENPSILTAASLDKAMKLWENFMSNFFFWCFEPYALIAILLQRPVYCFWRADFHRQRATLVTPDNLMYSLPTTLPWAGDIVSSWNRTSRGPALLRPQRSQEDMLYHFKIGRPCPF